MITEGQTDAQILNEAQKRLLNEEEYYTIIPCDPTPNASGGHSKLKSLLESLPHKDEHLRVGIFDRDSAGLGSFNSLREFELIDEFGEFSKRKHGNVFSCTLPQRDWDFEFFELAGRPIAIEQMFTSALIGVDNICAEFETKGGSISRDKVRKIIDMLGPEEAKKLVTCKLRILDKNKSTQNIIEAANEHFEPLRGLFDKIRHLTGPEAIF